MNSIQSLSGALTSQSGSDGAQQLTSMPSGRVEALSRKELRLAMHVGMQGGPYACVNVMPGFMLEWGNSHMSICCRHVQGWVHLQGTEYPPPASLKKELLATVREEIGPIATPDVIHWAPGICPTSASSLLCVIIIYA